MRSPPSPWAGARAASNVQLTKRTLLWQGGRPEDDYWWHYRWVIRWPLNDTSDCRSTCAAYGSATCAGGTLLETCVSSATTAPAQDEVLQGAEEHSHGKKRKGKGLRRRALLQDRAPGGGGATDDLWYLSAEARGEAHSRDALAGETAAAPRTADGDPAPALVAAPAPAVDGEAAPAVGTDLSANMAAALDGAANRAAAFLGVPSVPGFEFEPALDEARRPHDAFSTSAMQPCYTLCAAARRACARSRTTRFRALRPRAARAWPWTAAGQSTTTRCTRLSSTADERGALHRLAPTRSGGESGLRCRCGIVRVRLRRGHQDHNMTKIS